MAENEDRRYRLPRGRKRVRRRKSANVQNVHYVSYEPGMSYKRDSYGSLCVLLRSIHRF